MHMQDKKKIYGVERNSENYKKWHKSIGMTTKSKEMSKCILNQGGASGMEGALTLIFCKSETSRDIKK